MGLMNFAYGELIMAGGYTMFYTRDFGWLAMILITIVVVIVRLGADGARRVPARPARLADDAARHLVRGQLRAAAGSPA